MNQKRKRLLCAAVLLAAAQSINVALGARDGASLASLAFCWLVVAVVARTAVRA